VRKADNLPPSCTVVTKSGSLNFLEPSGPLQACNGTAKKKLCPILHIIASLLHLLCSFNILLHISDEIFFLAPSFPKYANCSHNSPLSTMLVSHTAPLVLLLFCTFLFLMSWIRLLISTGAILSNKCYFRPLFLFLYIGTVKHLRIYCGKR
jgi:hypothetical protein